jgi:polyisoprenoid-binding protein YceI
MIRSVARSVLLAVIGSLFLLAARPSAAQRAKPKPKPQLPPRIYTFDAQASEINIILTQEGLMRRRYTTHRVAAKSFNGKVELPSDETKLAVEVTAETKMLTNMDGGMSEFERKEFHANLRGPILEADKFPTIKFTSVSLDNLQKSGDKRSFTINGDLSLHGVTKRMAFPVTATINEKELRATGEAKLKQSDFGVKPFEKGMGLIKVGDELKVSFSVIAKTQ